ncbi:MAG: group 1 truncated hemoglobin [Candidatus Eremiobacteraeota bacterium]|nr:group 1 truncated hemoglobin [Candidatus Eremiobacteraeota bacterium]MBV8354268.1 group 1 truncated hemoglobin [Candidatus Eremiobacteraeota bacterium]
MQSDKRPTLYERLGGAYRIAAIVDDFIDRLAADDRLNANPKIKAATHSGSVAGLKYLVTEMTCWATGGPQVYTGRSMAESHKHLAITADEWQWFVDDFQESLDKYDVAKADQQELLQMLAASKAQIVA